MNEGDKAKLIDSSRYLLSDLRISSQRGKEVTLVRLLTLDERKSKRELSFVYDTEPVWWVNIPGGIQSFVPQCCLQPINQTQTNQNQNLKGNMYVYTVRALQTPNALAQQAGEKEKIVLPATDVVAENEYAAVAIVAAENAEAIKAVQESKGSLRIIIKSTGC